MPVAGSTAYPLRPLHAKNYVDYAEYDHITGLVGSDAVRRLRVTA